MINFVRLILFIPAMILGAFASILFSAIFNLPIDFLHWISSMFGDWSLGGLLFGSANIRMTEGLALFFTGVFMAIFGLTFGLNMFPYQTQRGKAVYMLFAILLLAIASPNNIEVYGSHFLYFAKLMGGVAGFAIILVALRDENGIRYFQFIDKKI